MIVNYKYKNKDELLRFTDPMHSALKIAFMIALR